MDRDGLEPEYWRKKPLDALSRREWEALCDGCGRCCLLKLEDDDTGEVQYTDVHCRLFDPDTCRCGSYALRRQLVPGCVVITPENVAEIAEWMPATCAYRLLVEGKDLHDWHPLVSGDEDSVHRAGVSMRRRTTPEYEVAEEDLENHVIEGII